MHQGTRNNMKINSFFAQSIFKRMKLLEKLNRVHSTKATSSQGSPVLNHDPTLVLRRMIEKDRGGECLGQRVRRTSIQ